MLWSGLAIPNLTWEAVLTSSSRILSYCSIHRHQIMVGCGGQCGPLNRDHGITDRYQQQIKTLNHTRYSIIHIRSTSADSLPTPSREQPNRNRKLISIQDKTRSAWTNLFDKPLGGSLPLFWNLSARLFITQSSLSPLEASFQTIPSLRLISTVAEPTVVLFCLQISAHFCHEFPNRSPPTSGLRNSTACCIDSSLHSLFIKKAIDQTHRYKKVFSIKLNTCHYLVQLLFPQ